jgi:hypothetical protein
MEIHPWHIQPKMRGLQVSEMDPSLPWQSRTVGPLAKRTRLATWPLTVHGSPGPASRNLAFVLIPRSDFVLKVRDVWETFREHRLQNSPELKLRAVLFSDWKNGLAIEQAVPNVFQIMDDLTRHRETSARDELQL